MITSSWCMHPMARPARHCGRNIVLVKTAVNPLFAADKPASIPVHPAGRYRRNTVVGILAREHGLFGLHTLHRLDKVTSGLLLLGRNPKAASRCMKHATQAHARTHTHTGACVCVYVSVWVRACVRSALLLLGRSPLPPAGQPAVPRGVPSYVHAHHSRIFLTFFLFQYFTPSPS